LTNEQMNARTPRRRAWEMPAEAPVAPKFDNAPHPRRAHGRKSVLLLGGTALAGLALAGFLAAGPAARYIAQAGSGEAAPAFASEAVADTAGASDLDALVPLPAGEDATAASVSEPAQDEAPVIEAAADFEPDTVQEAALPAIDESPQWQARLADMESISSPQAQELSAALQQLSGERPQTAASALESAFAGQARPDRVATSSIGGQAQGESILEVAVAESEADILALEEQQAIENEQLIASLQEEGTSFSTGPSAAAGNMVAATVSEYVNLRDQPGNNGSILTVVPANAAVQASQECPLQWCEVAFDGRSGYVFEGYVRHSQ
jgi:hypothetical protein